VLFSNDPAVLFQLVIDANDSVSTYWVGEAFRGNRILFLCQNCILDEGSRFVSDEDAAKLSIRLQPRGQIHLVADDGV